jgi:hypothetical protein
MRACMYARACMPSDVSTPTNRRKHTGAIRRHMADGTDFFPLSFSSIHSPPLSRSLAGHTLDFLGPGLVKVLECVDTRSEVEPLVVRHRV